MTGRWSESQGWCSWEGTGTFSVSSNHLTLFQSPRTSCPWKSMVYPYGLYSALSSLLPLSSPHPGLLFSNEPILGLHLQMLANTFIHLMCKDSSGHSRSCFLVSKVKPVANGKLPFSPKFSHATPTSQSVLFYCKEENESRRARRGREWKKRKKKKEKERKASLESSGSIFKAQENFDMPFSPSHCSFPTSFHLSPCVPFYLLWLSVHIHAQFKTCIVVINRIRYLPSIMQKSAPSAINAPWYWGCLVP